MMFKLKLIPICLIITIWVSACNSNGSKQIIQNHFNALNRHDIKSLVKDYAPNVQVTSTGWIGIHNGTKELIVDDTRYFHSSPDLKYDIEHAYFSGDSVVTVVYTSSGTLTNADKNTPPNMIGKKYILDQCTIFTIHDNRIVREQTYFDQFSFLRQMGLFDQLK